MLEKFIDEGKKNIYQKLLPLIFLLAGGQTKNDTINRRFRKPRYTASKSGL